MPERIEIIRGSYSGKNAWIDPEKKHSPKMAYVVIQMDDGSYKNTRLRKTSIEMKKAAPPATYEEAAVQHPKIKPLLEDLTRELAKCNITSYSNLMDIIYKKTRAAGAMHQANSSATYYNVDWKAPTEKRARHDEEKME